jgi:hypothetical protein
MTTAAFILFAIQICVALFQLSLVLGAPMGEYTLGGTSPGRLPLKLRVVSAISMTLNLAIAGHYLAQTGTLQTLLPATANGIANWVLVAFFALGLLMNSISRSKKERQLWVPVLLLAVVLATLIAFG